MKPVTIIAIKHQLMQFFSDVSLQKIAFQCGFIQRVRNIEPRVLILSLIAALSTGNVTSIAQLHQKFNGLCPDKKQQVSYRPFYNQLCKAAFIEFVKILVRFAMAQWVEKPVAVPKKLTKFQNVILQDGSSFKVHPALADVFPCRFKTTAAAVECHLTLSLFTQSPVKVLDLICRRNGYEFRLIRRWFAEEKRFCVWLTNLPVEEFTASDIMDIYRCRWQIELLFKELKSHTNWRGFTTRKETLATGLISGSAYWLCCSGACWQDDYSLRSHCLKQPKIQRAGLGQ